MGSHYYKAEFPCTCGEMYGSCDKTVQFAVHDNHTADVVSVFVKNHPHEGDSKWEKILCMDDQNFCDFMTFLNTYWDDSKPRDFLVPFEEGESSELKYLW